jgi:hypothetical protein
MVGKPQFSQKQRLSRCFPGGYFATPTQLMSFSYRAYLVTQVFWSYSAIGILNFHNPKALTNSGAFLEVATTLAIINAAAVSSDLCMGLSEFPDNFLHQMCINTDKKTRVGLLHS